MTTTGSQIPLPTWLENQNFPERSVWQKDDASTDDDENGVEPVKNRGVLEFVVDAGFEAQTFADHMGSGERKNGGGENGGVEETEGEEITGPWAGDGDEGACGVFGFSDVGWPLA